LPLSSSLSSLSPSPVEFGGLRHTGNFLLLVPSSRNKHLYVNISFFLSCNLRETPFVLLPSILLVVDSSGPLLLSPILAFPSFLLPPSLSPTQADRRFTVPTYSRPLPSVPLSVPQGCASPWFPAGTASSLFTRKYFPSVVPTLPSPPRDSLCHIATIYVCRRLSPAILYRDQKPSSVLRRWHRL
jgi:hypothetical protein